MSTTIQVNNLSKTFILAHQDKEKYTALRDIISEKAKKIFSFPTWMKPSEVISKEVFWALNNISFDINQGDRVGIIGRNGAGKSTLLKILSRITEPSSGSINIKGRVASLLEVGTGFHPELTGRENIFLNGAILGMSRKEIKMQFDAIVDFAEIERFLDTPVKRYSSGMYVRLAFAVAAHLEPEILIVDEVLAVGDAQFQKKCLGKMEDVSKNDGRTVLFVSHQMRVIQNLCNRTLVLNNGSLGFNGNLHDGLHYYENLIREQKNIQRINGYQLEMSFFSGSVSNPKSIHSSDQLSFMVAIDSPNDVDGNFINICIDNTAGDRIIQIRNDWSKFDVRLEKGVNKFSIDVDSTFLAPGIYDLWCRAVIGKDKKIIDTDYISLEITGDHDAGFIAHTGNWRKIIH